MMVALYVLLLLVQSAFAGIHGIYRTKEGKTLTVWAEGDKSRLALSQDKHIFCDSQACYFAYQDKKKWRVFNIDAVKETLEQTGLAAMVNTYMGEASRQLKKAQIHSMVTGKKEKVGSLEGEQYQVLFKRGDKEQSFIVVVSKEKLPLDVQRTVLHLTERAGKTLAKEGFLDFWAAIMRHFDAQHDAILKSDAFSLVKAEEKPLDKKLFELPAAPEMPFIFEFGNVNIKP